jgi:hypothetical protein
LLFLKQFLALNIDPDLEYFQECVWVEITVTDGRKLPVGNYYVTPDIKINVIRNDFNFLENRLNTSSYRVILLGGF